MISDHLAVDPLLDKVLTWFQSLCKNNLRILAPTAPAGEDSRLRGACDTSCPPSSHSPDHIDSSPSSTQEMCSSSRSNQSKSSASPEHNAINIKDILDGFNWLEAFEKSEKSLAQMREFGISVSDLKKFAALHSPVKNKYPRVMLSSSCSSRRKIARCRRRILSSPKLVSPSSPESTSIVKKEETSHEKIESQANHFSKLIRKSQLFLRTFLTQVITISVCLMSFIFVFCIIFSMIESPGIFLSKHLTLHNSGHI